MSESTILKLGGKEYEVMPLNLKQTKALIPLIEAMSDPAQSLTDRMEGIAKIAHASLSRRYPEITLSDVEELIDFGNMGSVISAIMGISGFQNKQPGEAVAGQV